MIRIVYQRDRHSVFIRGHAGSGEAGHDLVCAAASILAYTIAAYVKNMEAIGAASYSISVLRAGEAEIACTPIAERRGEIANVLDSLCEGFAILAREFPKNAKFLLL